MRELSEQTSRLVRQELDLAKLEVAHKGKRAGIGAGMFGGAGAVGLYALGALTAAVILALATAVTGWLAALIVAVVYGAIAGALALAGQVKGPTGLSASSRASRRQREGGRAMGQDPRDAGQD